MVFWVFFWCIGIEAYTFYWNDFFKNPLLISLIFHYFWRTSQGYCRILYWDFSRLDWGYGFLRETSQCKYFSSHHLKGTDYQCDILPLMLTLIIWLNWHFLVYLLESYYSALPFPPLPLLHTHTLSILYSFPSPIKEWGVMLSFEVELCT